MKEGLSARLGAESAFAQQSARDDFGRQGQAHFNQSTSRFEPVRAALEDLGRATGLTFHPRDQDTRMYCDVTIGGWLGYIIVDENSYSLYRRSKDWSVPTSGRFEEFEGSTADLQTFMGALAHCAGRQFPGKADEIQSAIDRHVPRKDQGLVMKPCRPS
jgi:hypothetical protein